MNGIIKTKKFTFVRGFVICIAIITVCFVALCPHSSRKDIGGGWSIYFRSPPLVASFTGSSCRIILEKGQRKAGELELGYDFMDSPVIVVPSSTNDDVVFCIYDNDSGYDVFRIDTAKSADGIHDPTGIIVNGSCEIQKASKEDVIAVIKCLQDMPASVFDERSFPARDFGAFKQYFEKSSSLDRLVREARYN
jgi:hypothetical protein